MDRRDPRSYSNNHRTSARQESGRYSRPKDTAYDGRFGSSADAGRKRPTGSYRSQPSGSYRSRMGYEEGSARRPSVRGSSDSYTRRPEPKAPPKPEKKRAVKKKGKRVNPLMLALVVLALLVLAALIAVVITSMGQTYHQLPDVQKL